jgi:hypothetical protein
METAVEATTSMEMALGALPHPGRVSEQRVLSPRNWSSMAAALRNFTGENAEGFRVFRREALYRRRGGVRKWTRGAHPLVVWPGGGAPPPSVVALCPPLRLSFGLRPSSGKIGVSTFILSNSENISCVAFLKHKNSRIQGTSTVASRQ